MPAPGPAPAAGPAGENAVQGPRWQRSRRQSEESEAPSAARGTGRTAQATSALDANAEKEVQDALDNVTALGNTTTLTIAHRLSTIQNSTLILVVSEGCIVESGSHEMLMQMENLYWNLVKNAERGGK